MSPDAEQQFIRIISGQARGPGASLARGFLTIVEPFYAGAITIRNHLFDRQLKSIRHLPRPVISIGNITTGGTGKTPMVQWLAENLRREGRRVAILSRGYRAAPGSLGDELSMLDRALNDPGDPPVLLRANSDRYAAGEELLKEHPEVDVFVLDDGFQHRRLARDLDVVLINAAEPSGFGRVLPRGLLREPLAGLRRAGAVVLTHADQATPEQLTAIEAEIRRHNATAPLYRAIHAQAGLRSSRPEIESHPFNELSRHRFFAFCGIGNPAAFHRQLARFVDTYVGRRWFGDHHAYTAEDLANLSAEARKAGAEILITTEKDWVKVEPFATAIDLPIWRAEVRIQFSDEDEPRLLDQVGCVLASSLAT
ncbi:MAG TPA: tetraacyldisaccharide 4'-kinase [Tepidisphaeraceae bacterium]|jgi:tetraacyldisaccharide 4'-kinase